MKKKDNEFLLGFCIAVFLIAGISYLITKDPIAEWITGAAVLGGFMVIGSSL